MVFSSSIFLWCFLPLLLLTIFAGPRAGARGVLWRNYWLTAASFVFYAWGEPKWVLPLFALAWVNYMLGKLMERHRAYARWWLAGGIVLDLGVLLLVKYGAWLGNACIEALQLVNLLPADAPLLQGMALPLGVSFFTFQAISYLVDIYRGGVAAASTYISFSCYLTMFSQLVAGPIVRYADIAKDIATRPTGKEGLDMFYAGVQRFVLGLGKKILIANQVALLADWVFQMDALTLGPMLAWIGILAYAAQIYYDFSAYSDMAIGLGLMFGFRFLENFRHPYASLSIQEFWRRWHISLSSWFRDYVYIPLGGNRISPLRTYVNLIVVFFLCGLWHGAAVNFVLWGLWHGAFLVLERAGWGVGLEALPRLVRRCYVGLEALPRLVRRCYVWLVFLGGWVLFRAEDMTHAHQYTLALLGLAAEKTAALGPLLHDKVLLLSILVASLVGSVGLPARAFLALRAKAAAHGGSAVQLMEAATLVLGVVILLLCSAFILAGSYNPFIYFRF